MNKPYPPGFSLLGGEIAPKQGEWRNDGSQFLFWEFLRNASLLLLSGLCFGTAVYMFVDMLAREIPRLMEVLK